MARGSSGRVVIEVEPTLKRELYAELARHDLTMKEWFIGQADRFLKTSRQPPLLPVEDWTESPFPQSARASVEEGEGE